MLSFQALAVGDTLQIRTLAAPANPLPFEVSYAETDVTNFSRNGGTFTNTVTTFLAGPTITGRSRSLGSYTVHNPVTNTAVTVILQINGIERFRVTLQAGDTLTQQGVYDLNGNLKGSNSAATALVFTRTSPTANTVTTSGSKSFTYTSATMGWIVGMRLRAAQTTNPTVNWVEGVITNVSATSVTIQVDTASNNSGTSVNNWSIGITGSVSVTANTPNKSQNLNANFSPTIADTGTLFNVTTGSGNIDITLPAASSVGDGYVLYVRKADTANGSVRLMLGGLPIARLSAVNDSYAVYSNGTTYLPLFDDAQAKTSLTMVSNGTATLDISTIGNNKSLSVDLGTFTGGTTENNALDIVNLTQQDIILRFTVRRDGTAGTKTVNFPDGARTYRCSWGNSPYPIATNRLVEFLVVPETSTEFSVSVNDFQA